MRATRERWVVEETATAQARIPYRIASQQSADRSAVYVAITGNFGHRTGMMSTRQMGRDVAALRHRFQRAVDRIALGESHVR